MCCSLPVPRSLAETLTIPFASTVATDSSSLDHVTESSRIEIGPTTVFNFWLVPFNTLMLASEISMLFDNEIVEKITRIKNSELILDGKADVTTELAAKIPLLGQYIPKFDLNGDLNHNRSRRVEDTVKVVSSKSTILKPIYEKAKEVRGLDDSKVGNLVKIRDVYHERNN